MTVQRKTEEIMKGSRSDVIAAVRQILEKNPPYSRTVELEESRLFKTTVKPHWWLAGTNMIIVLDEVENGIKINVQTVSQKFVLGDVFDFYRRYIRDFFEDLRKEVNARDKQDKSSVSVKKKYIFTSEKRLSLILLATTLACLIMLLYTVSQNRKYRERMITMTTYAAALEALSDFRHGVLRIYELREDGEREYANRNEGPFEIWYMPRYSVLGKPDMESMETFVQMYNKKMKIMYEKEKNK